MTPYLIIDGYNLMHAAGIARPRYAPGGLEACRARLHRELSARLDADVLAAAVVVYDAFDSVSDLDREQQHRGVNVLFAGQGRDADSLIERMLRQHSVPRRVIVVSSDHRLHRAARRRRARCVDSEDFWAELEADVRPHFESRSGQQLQSERLPESVAPTPSMDVVNEPVSRDLPENVPAIRGSQETLEEELLRWAATAAQEELAAEQQRAHRAAAELKAIPSSQNPDVSDRSRHRSAQKPVTPAKRRAEAAQEALQADIPGERAEFASEFADDYLKQLDDDLRHDRLQ